MNCISWEAFSQLCLKDAAWFLPDTLITVSPLPCTCAQVRDAPAAQCLIWKPLIALGSIPAVLDWFSGKIQEEKALEHFLQSHFWITKTSFVTFVCFYINVITVISLEASIIKYCFPGIFSNILLTLLNFKSADVCMALHFFLILFNNQIFPSILFVYRWF